MGYDLSAYITPDEAGSRSDIIGAFPSFAATAADELIVPASVPSYDYFRLQKSASRPAQIPWRAKKAMLFWRGTPVGTFRF